MSHDLYVSSTYVCNVAVDVYVLNSRFFFKWRSSRGTNYVTTGTPIKCRNVFVTTWALKMAKIVQKQKGRTSGCTITSRATPFEEKKEKHWIYPFWENSSS